jgi:hypothetical protein
MPPTTILMHTDRPSHLAMMANEWLDRAKAKESPKRQSTWAKLRFR